MILKLKKIISMFNVAIRLNTIEKNKRMRVLNGAITEAGANSEL